MSRKVKVGMMRSPLFAAMLGGVIGAPPAAGVPAVLARGTIAAAPGTAAAVPETTAAAPETTAATPETTAAAPGTTAAVRGTAAAMRATTAAARGTIAAAPETTAAAPETTAAAPGTTAAVRGTAAAMRATTAAARAPARLVAASPDGRRLAEVRSRAAGGEAVWIDGRLLWPDGGARARPRVESGLVWSRRSDAVAFVARDVERGGPAVLVVAFVDREVTPATLSWPLPPAAMPARAVTWLGERRVGVGPAELEPKVVASFGATR